MGLREQLQFSNMSPREQKLLTALGAVFGLFLFIGIPAYIYNDLATSRKTNDDIRKLLRDMDRAGELLAKRKSEKVALDLRYASPAPALASFIETAASANGLEVPESTDRPDNKGKGYTERVTVVKMRKVNLKPLVQMLEKIERSGHPVSLSMLSIKTRASAPDLYDVQLAVSAFDKVGATGEDTKGKDSDKTKKPKSKEKGTKL